MNCLWCDKPIKTEDKRNRKHCSKKCEVAKNTSLRSKHDRSQLNKNQVGAVSESLVKAHFMLKGYYVFEAVSSCGPIDLILMNADGELTRVEVKTGALHVKTGVLSYAKPRYNYDLLAVVIPEEDLIFVGRNEEEIREAAKTHS